MTPKALAEQYFANMRVRDTDALVEMFAENGVMILPDGREVRGHDALRAMYQQLFSMGAPSPSLVRSISEGRAASVEIEALAADGVARRMADFFDFDDADRIARLSIYRRG